MISSPKGRVLTIWRRRAPPGVAPKPNIKTSKEFLPMKIRPLHDRVIIKRTRGRTSPVAS